MPFAAEQVAVADGGIAHRIIVRYQPQVDWAEGCSSDRERVLTPACSAACSAGSGEGGPLKSRDELIREIEVLRAAVDTQIGTGQLASLWAIRFVTPNPSLCDLKIVAVIDRERMQQLCSAHLALHSGMIVFHVDADGPDRLHGQVTGACRRHIPDVENIRPCCVPEGCGSALDGKRRGTPVRAQTLLRPAEAAVCREDPKRYPERSFRYRRLFASRRRVRSKAWVIVASRV